MSDLSKCCSNPIVYQCTKCYSECDITTGNEPKLEIPGNPGNHIGGGDKKVKRLEDVDTIHYDKPISVAAPPDGPCPVCKTGKYVNGLHEPGEPTKKEEAWEDGLYKEVSCEYGVGCEHYVIDIEKVRSLLASERARIGEELIRELEGMAKPNRHFSREDDGRNYELSPTGRHSCNQNCKPDMDEAGYNNAITEAIDIIRTITGSK